jgi:hypothetical protein
MVAYSVDSMVSYCVHQCRRECVGWAVCELVTKHGIAGVLQVTSLGSSKEGSK